MVLAIIGASIGVAWAIENTSKLDLTDPLCEKLQELGIHKCSRAYYVELGEKESGWGPLTQWI